MSQLTTSHVTFGPKTPNNQLPSEKKPGLIKPVISIVSAGSSILTAVSGTANYVGYNEVVPSPLTLTLFSFSIVLGVISFIFGISFIKEEKRYLKQENKHISPDEKV